MNLPPKPQSMNDRDWQLALAALADRIAALLPPPGIRVETDPSVPPGTVIFKQDGAEKGRIEGLATPTLRDREEQMRCARCSGYYRDHFIHPTHTGVWCEPAAINLYADPLPPHQRENEREDE